MSGINTELDGTFSSPRSKKIVKEIKAFAKEVSKLFPDGDTMLNITDEGNNISFVIDVVDGEGESLLMMERFVNEDKNQLDLDMFALDERYQGKSIGKSVHQAQLRMSQRLGLSRYFLQANMEVGGYAWLKYGMKPLKEEDLIRAMQKYLASLTEESPEWYLFRKHYQKAFDSKSTYKYVMDNIDVLKPALLGSSYNAALDFNDEAQFEMYKSYIRHKPNSIMSIDENVFIERQVVAERYKASVVKKYEAMLKELDKKIRLILTEESLSNSEVKKTLTQLRKETAAIYAQQYEDTIQEIRSFYTLEDVWNSETIYNVITLDNWDLALKTPISANGEMLKPYLKDLSTRQIKRIEGAILTGRAQNETLSQILTRVRGTKATNYRNGVIRKGLNDARTVIRTGIQHAATRARVNTWLEVGIEKYRWVSTLDRGTSPQCRHLDGLTFIVDQGPLPPIHPGCRSTVIPDFGEPLGTRSSEDGYVPANMTYYEWMKSRSDAAQDFALGPTRAKLLRDGGLSATEFSDLQLDRNFQPLTLDEMRKLKPDAFTKANI